MEAKKNGSLLQMNFSRFELVVRARGSDRIAFQQWTRNYEECKHLSIKLKEKTKIIEIMILIAI